VKIEIQDVKLYGSENDFMKKIKNNMTTKFCFDIVRLKEQMKIYQLEVLGGLKLIYI
jgi:hypothetical protein